MLTHHRKRAILVVIRGMLLILLAVILDYFGYLSHLESMLKDDRVRYCQQFRPPPSPALVHLDVDDNSLNYIGHWPWPSKKLARIIDEITLAKPKTFTIDTIFVEPREIKYGKNDSVGEDEDAELAAAFKRLNCALIPVSLKFEASSADSKLSRLLLPLLIKDPDRTEAQCAELLRSQGISDSDFAADSANSFFSIRELAFYDRIWQEVLAQKDSPPDRAKIKQAMLPREDPLLTETVLGDLFNEQYDKVMREKTIQRFTLSVPADSPLLLHSSEETAPILPLGQAADYSGFVDYLPESVEGTVREVPLVVQYRDRLFLQMGLVTACAYLGVDIHSIRLSADTLTIPRVGQPDVVIPVSSEESKLGQVGMLMQVPLFGRPNDWATMYDFPNYKKPAKQVSVYEIWRICQTQDKLKINQATADNLLLKEMEFSLSPDAAAYAASPPTGEARRAEIQKTLESTKEFIHNLEESDTDPDAQSRQVLNDGKKVDAELRLIVGQNDKLEVQLTQMRSGLFDKLHDRAIFFGGTATSLSDLRPTSLFGSSPGVIVHGAVFNAIMTNKMWTLVSANWGLAATVLIGFITLLMVANLSPLKAFAASLTLVVGYLAFNGYLLFARQNLIVDAAGPSVAVALVWSGMTLMSFLTEIAERSRITRRFRSYVDPSLVDWMIEHPESARFDGERREMSLCFSDLAGFTTLTDELGERVVPLLAEYMGKMVPVIRNNGGHVVQQIGDGIFFFFGAPEPNPHHAQHAINTALKLHQALAQFNDTLRERGNSPLGMRIGISTGDVIVGDAGPDDASSYTAMGANTNLAARMESANKFFGTRTLITARTVELSNDQYLVRPIANLQVKGKLNCVVVYEPICPLSESTEEQRNLARCTDDVFKSYRTADFHACITATDEMERDFGVSTFTKLYKRLSTQHLTGNAEVEHCEGQIVLTEK